VPQIPQAHPVRLPARHPAVPAPPCSP